MNKKDTIDNKVAVSPARPLIGSTARLGETRSEQPEEHYISCQNCDGLSLVFSEKYKTWVRCSACQGYGVVENR